MKYLTDRTEFAKAINFNKYPVIAIDTSKHDEYGIVGIKVRIEKIHKGEIHYTDAVIRTYNDNNKLKISSFGTTLRDRLSYRDYLEMLEFANAPILRANQEFVLCLYNSETKAFAIPVILETGSRVEPFCSTPLSIEPFTVI